MRKRIFLLLSLAVLLLGACQSNNSQPAATAEPSVEPTEEPTAVPPTAVPTEVDTGSEATDQDALVAQSWQWLSFQGAAEGFEILNPQDYLLTFNEDDTVNIKADCNNAAGSYTADESSLTINIGPVTLAACPPGSRSDQFIQMLASAAKYFLEDANLRIELMADGGNMHFAPAGTAAIQPTAMSPTATPIPPTAVPPTAVPSPPGSVVDSGPRPYANGTYQAPYYTVAAGDTLFSIGQRFGVPFEQISAANALVNNAINAGQMLLIPGGGGSASPPAGGQFERVVFAPGDIAATLNGVIAQGQPKGYVLGGRAGQVLEIGTTSNGEALEVTVQTADGWVFPLNGENGKIQNNLWLPLSETGDYFVSIRPVTPPESPSLAFIITFVIQ